MTDDERAALEAADDLADAAHYQARGLGGECVWCGAGDLYAPPEHAVDCPIAVYRAVRARLTPSDTPRT